MKKLINLTLLSLVFLSSHAFAEISSADKAIVIIDAKTSTPVDLATISIVAQTLSKEYYSSAMVIYRGYAFNKLPGLGLTFNKVTDGSYSVERRGNNAWHKAETMNYRFTAKVMVER